MHVLMVGSVFVACRMIAITGSYVVHLEDLRESLQSDCLILTLMKPEGPDTFSFRNQGSTAIATIPIPS